MAAELLLINPRKRKARKTAAKRRARKTSSRRRNPIAAKAVMRRANPVRRRRSVKRRRNPISARRRNPIALRGMFGGVAGMLRDAAIGATGAIAVDAAMGQVNKYLPAGMQPTPGAVGVNDAVKAGVTVALGTLLSKVTRGMSRKAAAGALTVQMDKVIRTFLPATVKAQLAYGTVAPVIPGRMTVQPNAQRMNAYQRPGQTALLSAYQRGGVTPLLNRGPAMTSEGRSRGASR